MPLNVKTANIILAWSARLTVAQKKLGNYKCSVERAREANAWCTVLLDRRRPKKDE